MGGGVTGDLIRRVGVHCWSWDLWGVLGKDRREPSLPLVFCNPIRIPESAASTRAGGAGYVHSSRVGLCALGLSGPCRTWPVWCEKWRAPSARRAPWSSPDVPLEAWYMSVLRPAWVCWGKGDAGEDVEKKRRKEDSFRECVCYLMCTITGPPL